MGTSLEPIINKARLKEDMAEGLAYYLKVDIPMAAKYITDDVIEECVSKMLDTENEIIQLLGLEILQEIRNV